MASPTTDAVPAVLLAAPLAVVVAFAVVQPVLLATLAGVVWLVERLPARLERAWRGSRRRGAAVVRAVAAAERRVERAVADEVAEVRAAVAPVATPGARGPGAGTD